MKLIILHKKLKVKVLVRRHSQNSSVTDLVSLNHLSHCYARDLHSLLASCGPRFDSCREHENMLRLSAGRSQIFCSSPLTKFFGHRYFSTEKSRDPSSRRRAPALRCSMYSHLTRLIVSRARSTCSAFRFLTKSA